MLLTMPIIYRRKYNILNMNNTNIFSTIYFQPSVNQLTFNSYGTIPLEISELHGLIIILLRHKISYSFSC